METQGAQLAARHARILLFSYGSGSTSTLIDLQAWTDLQRPDAAGASRPVSSSSAMFTSSPHHLLPWIDGDWPYEGADKLSLGPTWILSL